MLNTSARRLSSTPIVTQVDDGELISFVLSTYSLSSNYRQLKGTDLTGVTSVKLVPSNIALTIISASAQSLFVQFPLGVGMNYSISVFVGSSEYSSSATLVSTFSYQRNCLSLPYHETLIFLLLAGPIIASVSPSIVAGGSLVSIVGTGFGSKDYTLSVSFGVTSCEYVTFSSDSRITAKVSNGVGRHNIEVNVQGQYASIAASYLIPISIRSIPSNFPCSSAVFIRVEGSFFGSFDSSIKVGVAGTICESTRWHASSSIICKFSRGFGTVLPIAVTVSSQIGTVTSAVSFDRLFLTSLSSFNAPCFSPGSLSIFGKGFGFPSLDAAAAIGASMSSGTVISSDSSLLSNIFPGTGSSLSISITIAGVTGSMTNVFSYDGTYCFFLHMYS